MDESYEEPRQSMLNLLQERMAQKGRTVSISRIVYVARPVALQENTRNASDFHQILFSEAIGDTNEKCTGLLLVYPNVILHVIEAPSPILLALLHSLGERVEEKEEVDLVRILSSTDDIKARVFKNWNTAMMAGEIMESYDAAEGDDVVPLASEVNLTALKVGGRMLDMSKAEVDAALRSPALAFPELPTIQVLQSLLLSEEIPKSKEYLDIFDSILDVDLDSENVWPVTSTTTITF